ncbi:MAG: GAP family protein [Gordonia sp. (in: high G+C Gram-positive bacteria)]|uniref:GAP family protein n=1 Tax=Gordonia sp. (in: high G+C Gram-positive bacteria) TaxID=84139 RepID=UPI003BB654EA
MWDALGGTFALAMALTLSPLSITAVLVLGLGARGTLRALLFSVGWFISMFAITFITALVTGTAVEEDPEGTSGGIDILHLVFGVLFFILAYITWRRRPSAKSEVEHAAVGEEKEKNGLFARIDNLGLASCVAVGFAMGLLIIKNPPLAISAGVQLGSVPDITTGQTVIVVLIFAALATIAPLALLGFMAIGGPKVRGSLQNGRTWIEANMTAVTLAILLIVGTIFLGEGLAIID